MWAETRAEALLLVANISQTSVPAASPPGQRKRPCDVGFNQEGAPGTSASEPRDCCVSWDSVHLPAVTGSPLGMSPGGVAFLGTELVLACLWLPGCTSAREQRPPGLPQLPRLILA